MKDLNKKIKKDFENINLSKEEESNILNNIYLDYFSYKKRKNITLSICLILFISFIGLGITYADEIVKYFKTSKVTYKSGKTGTYGKAENIFKVINYDADIPTLEKNDYNKTKKYSVIELEELLGFKIVKSKKIKNDTITQLSTMKEKGKISSASFKFEEFYNNKITKAKLYFIFKTKYDTSKQNYLWETGQARQSSDVLIKNLNTNAYILQFKGEKWTSYLYEINFIYDNVAYSALVTSSAHNPKDKEKEIMDFLDSLYI